MSDVLSSSEGTLEFAPRADSGARARALVSAWAVPAIIALDTAGLIWLAMRLNIWVDEAYTLQTTSHGLAYAIHQSIFWELQPPVYFVLIAMLHMLTPSILGARLFSIGCIAAMLWVAGAISSRLWPSQNPAWLVLVLAVNPVVVGVAVEIRVYALVMLLSALLIYFFITGYLQTGDVRRVERDAGGWPRIAFVVTAIVALYTQYYLGFLLFGLAAALIVLQRWPQLRLYLLSMAVVAVCAIPILFVLHYQLSANSVNFVSHLSPAKAVLLESKILASALVSADALPSALRWFLALGCAAVTLLVIAALRKRGSSGPSEPTEGIVLPFAVVGAGGAALALVVSAASQQLTLRYSTALFFPAMLCVYAALAGIPRQLHTRALAVWTAIALATSGIALASDYKDTAKIGDWIRVASYIGTHEVPGQPIVIFEPQAALPLSHYYHGPNVIVPMPRPIDLKTYDLRESALRNERDVDATFALAGGSGQVWMVTTAFCRREPIDFHCELLDKYLGAHYVVLRDEHFYWSRVRLLERVH